MATTAAKTTDKKAASSDRFKELAEARTGRAIAAIRQLVHLANGNTYEYTEDQVNRIEAALKTETDAAIRALRERKVPRAAGFTL